MTGWYRNSTVLAGCISLMVSKPVLLQQLLCCHPGVSRHPPHVVRTGRGAEAPGRERALQTRGDKMWISHAFTFNGWVYIRENLWETMVFTDLLFGGPVYVPSSNSGICCMNIRV